MIKNYFKSALRNMLRNKSFSVINIAGLAIGLAVFLLILLWVDNELSYNNFHSGSDRIMEVMSNRSSGKEVSTFPAVPSMLAQTMKKDLPGIEYVSRTSWGDVRLFADKEHRFSEYGLYVDPDFFKVFSFPLVKGDLKTVLQEPNTLLLTEKLAKKYFGDEDPIGKTIMVEQRQLYTVKGVVKDVPDNSSIRFDFLMPMQDYVTNTMGGNANWTNNNIRTYVKLAAGADPVKLNGTVKKFMEHYTDQQPNIELFLWNIHDWYLKYDFKNGVYAGGGRITYVNMFILVAIFILLLACINFMNLSTARATQRAKEVGVRKAIGAGRAALVGQFIGESLVTTVLAGIIALLIALQVLPFFNQLLTRNMAIDFANIRHLAGYVGILLLTGLLAGLYPAFVLSGFKPALVFKAGSERSGTSTSWVRKTLVVTQFVVSTVLIIGTIVVYQQVNFIKNKSLGYNRENLVWFPNSIAADKNDAAISEFKKIPGVANVARATTTFTSPNNRGADVKWPGKTNEDIFFTFITGDHNIVQTMGIEMKEGRAFSKEYTTDTAAFIVNEEAVKRMGLKDPIGQPIETYGGKGKIIGVAKDFHVESLHNPITPVIMECRPEWTWLFYIRLTGHDVPQTLSRIEAIYKEAAPGYLFDYTFQDQEYERLYRSEQQIGVLANWFAFFAVFISCLGLLGLSVFTVERKTKEIGIRKVLGASVLNIVSLVSRQFLLLTGLAVLIALAPSWYFMNEWLQNYSYHIDIGSTTFILAGGITLLVAFITTGIMALRAARTNPVKSLRTE